MVVSAEMVPWKQVVLKVDHQGVSLTNGGQEDTEESFAFEKKNVDPKKQKLFGTGGMLVFGARNHHLFVDGCLLISS